MRTKLEELGIIVLFVLLLATAFSVGQELQRLRLENEQLAAECAIKTEALQYLNSQQ